MMGSRREAQASLSCEFNLEDHGPADHLLRSIDRLVDPGDIGKYLAPFHSDIGRPSVDPGLMIRILLIGHVMGIRSQRRPCEDIHVSLACRWSCRLDPGDPVPDQSAVSKNGHGRLRESDMFRQLLESVVARCIEEGLVGGDILAADAGIIRAGANKRNSTPKEAWDPTSLDPETVPRAVKEHLDILDEAAFGGASEVEPKFTSHGGPASQWTGALEGPAFFAHADNSLIDADNAIIVDVEASRAIRQAEVGATRTMTCRTRGRFGLHPEMLAADTAHGTAETLDRLVHDEGILPHIPVFDRSRRNDGAFPDTAFTFNHEADEYRCPGGRRLKRCWRRMTRPRTGVGKEGFMRHLAGKGDCPACPFQSAHRRPDAHPTSQLARSPVTFAKVHVTLLARSPRQMLMSIHDDDEGRSKCCLHTSSAS